MGTRGRRKFTGTSQTSTDSNADQPPVVATGSDRFQRKKTRVKTKVPAARKNKVVSTPVKKQAPSRKKPTWVPKFGAADDGSDDSELLEDPEWPIVVSESDDDS